MLTYETSWRKKELNRTLNGPVKTVKLFPLSFPQRLPRLDGGVIGMAARFKDITERKYAENMLKEANERLERLGSDGLTQVANRRCFDQTLEREWNRLRRTGEPLSLIMSDVDFFKLFNDIRPSARRRLPESRC